MANIKALVLGEDTRSFLSVIRSLGQMGFVVDVICYDNTSPALKSKYVNQSWNINHQAFTEDDWLKDISELITKEQYDLVFPCDERSIFPLSTIQDSFAHNIKFAIPNKQVLDHLFDKNKTRLIAEKLGVPVAKGQLQTLALNDFDNIKNTLSLPFVVKPTESFTANNLSRRNKVEIIGDKKAYQDYIKHIKPSDMFLIEEYFPGVGEGLSLFAIQGEVKCAFAHKRVHEPRSGGGSSYRVAIGIDPELLTACQKICEETQYDGVGMFEFKRNTETGAWILIEVNARFWGSLPLAIFAGIDFPQYYAKYLLGNDKPTTLDTNYRIDAKARSFTNDVYDARVEMNYVRQNQGAFQSYWFLLNRLCGFLKVLGDECIDSYMKEDPAPFKREFKQLLASISGKFLSAYKANRQYDLIKDKLIKDLNNALDNDGKAIFVCYGNIMRSPFAERYFNKIKGDTKWPLEAKSFGFHQKESRQSPVICQECAPNYDVDLSEHRSKWLKQADIGKNDIVFIFDKANEEKITKYYNAPRLYNLADFVRLDGKPIQEISDPWGHAEKDVARCYGLIVDAINNIFVHSVTNKN